MEKTNFNKFVNVYDEVIKTLIFILFTGMVFSTFLGTLFRYVRFLPSLFWASEVSIFLFIWSILLISGHGIREGTHLGLNYLILKLPDKPYKIIYTVGNIFVLSFLLILFRYGIEFTLMNTGQLSSSLRIPMSYVFISIPIGSFLMIIELIIKNYLIITNKISREEIYD